MNERDIAGQRLVLEEVRRLVDDEELNGIAIAISRRDGTVGQTWYGDYLGLNAAINELISTFSSGLTQKGAA